MAHVHELYDFTSSAYIVHSGKILLLHHKKLGMWIAPGGHIELDEDPMHALWREIAEETGLPKNALTLIELQADKPSVIATEAFMPLPLPFATFVVDYDESSAHKHIDFCYLLISSSDKIVYPKEEAHDIGWFTKEQMEQLHKDRLMFDNSYQYCLYALKNAPKK